MHGILFEKSNREHASTSDILDILGRLLLALYGSLILT